ncbi:hypothetical protein LU293_08775 [Moraxella nasovis]|uniref:hypothetical protein n=1 Tax=Moraxella nasovis TaxID=2904121 RepID=UPI001F61C36D|nr:hypothetical protein [Moraxella nasovis]UNU73154.1 hypothetical protein LU293_08775 [Moraxella nasovis]
MHNISPKNQANTKLVPLGITVGLAIFAFALAVAGYGFRLLAGDELGAVIRHALVVVSFFMIVIPALFVGGAKLLNKFSGTQIQTRNAVTLGYLMACVMILTIMGRYS